MCRRDASFDRGRVVICNRVAYNEIMRTIVENTFQEIRSQGKKLTKTRKAIIEMLCRSHRLLTAFEIQENLNMQGIAVNKTSVYRELEFLVSRKIIQQVSIAPGVTHYESALNSHHHHLVCTGCEGVVDIDAKEFEEQVHSIEARVKQKGFVVKNHLLEFYGLCANCK